jgi:DNA (cytosine-5)-methyltransferase 1
MSQPTVIDLFCGAGGMSHGFAQAGFRVLAGVDHDDDSLATFGANHPGSQAIKADIEKLSPQELAAQLGVKPGELDCLVGGPPCQGFSRNRAFRHKDGTFVDDPRNQLYQHFFRFVEYLRPKVVVIENVPEILIKSNANGHFREAVDELFEEQKYRAISGVLNAAEYGVPQWRRRAFFIAGREHQKVMLPEPTTRPGPRAGRRTPQSAQRIESKKVVQQQLNLSLLELEAGPTVWDAIGDLCGVYASDLTGTCRYASDPFSAYQKERRNGSGEVRNHFPWKLSDRQLQRIRLLREGQGQLHLPVELQTKQGYGSAYRRLQSDAQALTITTWLFHPGSGMFTHPFEDRVITIREAARLQSFQDDFVFFGRYHSLCRQVGNAVAPLVARNIAQTVRAMLGYSRLLASAGVVELR